MAVPKLRGSTPRSESLACVLLISALLAASAVLVFDFSSFTSPKNNPPPPAANPSPGPHNGEIVIAIGLAPWTGTIEFSAEYGGANLAFLPNIEFPQLPPVNFTIQAQGSGYPTSSVVVSQPGRVEVARPAGLYLVSTKNSYYNFSAQLPVDVGSVTELGVNVSQSMLQPDFVQAYDPDSTGVMEPWQSVVVQTAVTTEAPRQGGTVFLEAAPLTSCTISNSTSGSVGLQYYMCGPPGPTIVRAVILQADSRADGLWLLLRPSQPLPLGTADLYIYSVGETHTVTFPG